MHAPVCWIKKHFKTPLILAFETNSETSLNYTLFRIWSLCAFLLVLERTPKYRTSNTPNIECPNIELSEHHILAQNWTSNMSNITKNWTVHEHPTVRSKTSFHLLQNFWKYNFSSKICNFGFSYSVYKNGLVLWCAWISKPCFIH